MSRPVPKIWDFNWTRFTEEQAARRTYAPSALLTLEVADVFVTPVPDTSDELFAVYPKSQGKSAIYPFVLLLIRDGMGQVWEHVAWSNGQPVYEQKDPNQVPKRATGSTVVLH